MALESYARNVFGSRQLGDLSLVLIQAVMVSGAPVLTASASSPNVTIALAAPGNFTVTFPNCVSAHLIGAWVSTNGESAGVGQSVHWETLVPSAGTGSFETTSETVDTPVTPVDGDTIYVTLLCGAP